jgi:hypothetical protein
MDFHYLAQAPTIGDNVCHLIEEALKEFHAHKLAIIEAGAYCGEKGKVIDNWYIPKLEFLQSVVPSIRASGAAFQWSADITEHAHITEIKNPAHAMNNQTMNFKSADTLTVQINVDVLTSPLLFVMLESTLKDAKSMIQMLRMNLMTWMLLLLPLHSWHGLNWCCLIPPQPILLSTTLNSLKGFNMANSPLHQHRFAQSPVWPMLRFTFCAMQALPGWKLMMLLQNISFLICDLHFRIMSVVQEIAKALSQLLVVVTHHMKAVNFHLINSKYGTRAQLQGKMYHHPHDNLPPQTVNVSPPSSTSPQESCSDAVLINTDCTTNWPYSGLRGMCCLTDISYLISIRACCHSIVSHHVHHGSSSQQPCSC